MSSGRRRRPAGKAWPRSSPPRSRWARRSGWSRCRAGSARAGPRRIPAGGCATGTTCAGIAASAARGSRPASRNWLAGQVPFDGYGPCQVAVCPDLAATPLGLCSGHESRYQTHGRPGGAALPPAWSRRYEVKGLPVPVALAGEEQFRAWCAAQPPVPWPGQIILAGLAPLPAAEIRWGLFAHTQRERHTRWDTGWVQALVNTCRTRGTGSLTELDLSSCTTFAAMVAREMLHDLRLAYFTPEASRDAGFIETDHFGVRFPERGSHFDLTGIGQRWLRDLLWDYLADLLRSPGCPRTGGTFDAFRRAATELGAFLAVDAPGGGHDPAHAGRRAHPAVRRRPAAPRTRGAGVPGDAAAGRHAVDRHHDHPGHHLQPRPQAAAVGAGLRCRRADRAVPAVHHRDARGRAHPAAQAQPVPRRGGPRPGRRGQPRPARRGP